MIKEICICDRCKKDIPHHKEGKNNIYESDKYIEASLHIVDRTTSKDGCTFKLNFCPDCYKAFLDFIKEDN